MVTRDLKKEDRRQTGAVDCERLSKRPWVRAAIEQQILTDDVARMHAAQERAGRAELRRIAEAPDGNGVARLLQHMIERIAGGLGAALHRGSQARRVETAWQK